MPDRGPDLSGLARTLGMTVPAMLEHASVRATLARLDAGERAARERMGEAEYAAYCAWQQEVFAAITEGEGGER